MNKQDLESRYHYWIDIANISRSPKMKRAAKVMSVLYKRRLEGMEEIKCQQY